jgi:hypothetical protein
LLFERLPFDEQSQLEFQLKAVRHSVGATRVVVKLAQIVTFWCYPHTPFYPRFQERSAIRTRQRTFDFADLRARSSAAGMAGPTIFLPSGSTIPAGLEAKNGDGTTDGGANYLERHGAAPGSSIHMTKSAYMSSEA